MKGPGSLTVGGGVVREMVRLAALGVPGVVRVGRSGPPWRRLLGRGVQAQVRDARVDVRLWIIARPGQALGPLTADVRTAVAGAVERLLGLELGGVTVLIDGVGG